MALSPEEVLQNNLNPLLSGIGQYGHRLADEQKTKQDREYAQRLLQDARAYEDSRHEKYRSEGKVDTEEAANKAYRRKLEEEANSLGIDPAGKSDGLLASLVDAAGSEKKLKDSAELKRQDQRLNREGKKEQSDQDIRDQAQAAGIKDYKTADITDLQTRLPAALEQKAIRDEGDRNKMLDEELGKPENQKVVQEYDSKAKELARQAAGFYGQLNQGPGNLSPAESAKATREAFASVAADPFFAKHFKSVAAAAKNDPQIAAALQRFQIGTPTPQDQKMIFSDPSVAMAMVTAYGAEEDAVNKLHVMEGRNNQYTARQQDAERLRYMAEDLRALQKKHSFLSGRPMYNTEGLTESQGKPTLGQPGGGVGGGSALPLPPSTFRSGTQNPIDSPPTLPVGGFVQPPQVVQPPASAMALSPWSSNMLGATNFPGFGSVAPPQQAQQYDPNAVTPVDIFNAAAKPVLDWRQVPGATYGR